MSYDSKGGPPPGQGKWAARIAVAIPFRCWRERQRRVVPRDSRICLRDFCATFRRIDAEP